MIGHDFTTGQRAGAKGYPRFTDPALRGPQRLRGYLRAAAEASLERCGVDALRPADAAQPRPHGLQLAAGVGRDGRAARRRADRGHRSRPGAGQRVHAGRDLVPGAVRRPDRLGDADPEPVRAVAGAAGAAGLRAGRTCGCWRGSSTTAACSGTTCWTRRSSPSTTTAASGRPGGSARARGKLDRIRPIGDRHGLTPMQLAAAWTLAQPAVSCVVPTLIQEAGPRRQAGRAEAVGAGRGAGRLAAVRGRAGRDRCRRRQRRQHGAEGGVTRARGRARPDAWPLDDDLRSVAERWGIAPERDLVMHA